MEIRDMNDAMQKETIEQLETFQFLMEDIDSKRFDLVRARFRSENGLDILAKQMLIDWRWKYLAKR